MLGVDGLPRGVQIIAASFEDRTAIACAAMLEALGASFRARRRHRLERGGKAYDKTIRGRGKSFLQVRPVSFSR
jgi:hypothetical protein